MLNITLLIRLLIPLWIILLLLFGNSVNFFKRFLFNGGLKPGVFHWIILLAILAISYAVVKVNVSRKINAWLLIKSQDLKSHGGKFIALVVLVTLFCLTCFEVVLRIVFPYYGDPAQVDMRYLTFGQLQKLTPYEINGKNLPFLSIFSGDPYTVFKNKKDFKGSVREGGITDITYNVEINQEGWRDSRNYFPVKSKLPKIMFLGDSTTYGQFVNNRDIYPKVVEKLLGGKALTYNFAAMSYGFAEYSQLFFRYHNEVKPDLTVVGVFPRNDFKNLNRTDWEGKFAGNIPAADTRLSNGDVYFDEENDALRRRNSPYRFPILRNLKTFVLLYRVYEKVYSFAIQKGIIEKYYYKSKGYDPVEYSKNLLDQMANTGRLLVLLLPCHKEGGDLRSTPDAIQGYKESLQERGLEVIDLEKSMRALGEKAFSDHIGHPSKEGHQVIAEEILSFIEKDQKLSQTFERKGR